MADIILDYLSEYPPRECHDRIAALCDTYSMSPIARPDPKSVQVHLTEGTGMDIEWKDGHKSIYTFQYLRDACPCALCDDERQKQNREPGEPAKAAPGALPMFKAAPKAVSAEGVGRYAIRFTWSDGHEHGIYSWDFLREFCPCRECSTMRRELKQPGGGVTRTTPH
jgi:DUF971 family protein